MKMSYLGVTRKYISKLLVKLRNKINIGRLNTFFSYLNIQALQIYIILKLFLLLPVPKLDF